ncbi:MAG: protein translocase subunit SecDF [Flavobacteriaceae bacterium]|jgi:SecD/SecF fusion protein|nr:protein translocase subunit SecDF [Flavobacteriaceae bacterium]MBT4113459.1 protein translocase subunit SecDF [Flavobacteriaceae bacterium]MBT4613568.1 protein translocase subunit SecDF [Flavobacteriaceae bacterium]MBT5245977.1 protein translocase subunit SecDF [Flavobacteriaceae bacterium]MBT5650341.1 protein translocase subunit SecDF [Flavobacteriaceae bacterium]
MQNKGLIKFLAWLFGLVCIFQLVLTFQFNQTENRADNYSTNLVDDTEENFDTKRRDLKIKYLDSISNIPVFNILIADYTYDELKKKSMKLGLDLKGGINAILQISVNDILKSLSNNSTDPIFNKALSDAEEMQKNSQNTYLEDFFIAFDNIKGDGKLASPDIFANRNLSEEITFNMSDEEVRVILEKKIDESIESALQVLRKRVDPDGLLSPVIQRIGSSARILFELPGAKDVERIKKLLQGTAQLEFWDAFKGEEFINFIVQANEVVKNIEDSSDESLVDSVQDEEVSEIEELLGSETQVDSIVNPILDLIRGQGYPGGPIIFSFDTRGKDEISKYLSLPEVRSLLSTEQRYVKFLWGITEVDDEGNEYSELYALKGNRENKPLLNGSVITDARQSFGMDGISPTVSMQMNSKGAKIWEKMTGDAFSQGSQIAIVLDDIIYSAPGVTTGPISGGNSEISGSFDTAEAIDLANVLRAGKLPASADIIQADEVGPSLGQEAIDSGILSFLIALILVLVWMIFYYGKAGIYSNLALVFNVILIFGVLAGSDAVLTLPGIAGIVLTIGIAVDANVLIYERVREELYSGKKLKAAIVDGYHNAYSSILDANITTGLTALILKVFGTGPVEGFATTLLIGIITSLFTAIFISRLLVNWDINRGSQFNFSTYFTKGLFRNMSIDFLKYRKMAYILSFVVISSGLFSLFTSGLDQGIDFVGGRTYTIRFDRDMNTEEVRQSTDKVFGSSEIKTIGSPNQLKISTKYRVDENTAEADEDVQRKLYESLETFLPENYTYDQFLNAENNVGKMMSAKVSPTIADDIKQNSFLAVLGSLVVVFLYILFRFRKWQFSLGAVAAVFHDVLIVLGIFSLTYRFMPFSMEIDQAFIAAILTVIGYSLNDTVVVFDRIREFLNEHSTWEFKKTVNSALNSTLSRTLNTSFTTLVVLLSMFVFGADSLRGLLFALIVGVVVGTYSSVFVATPIMHDTIGKFNK